MDTVNTATTNPDPTTDSEFQKAESNYRRYLRARDNGHIDFLKTKRTCTDYYVGDQWEKSVREKLEAEGRPALTINKVLSTVNVLLGEQLARRAGFQAKVRKDSSEEQAQVLTKVLMQVAEANDYDDLETEVFRDGVIGGRGYFDVRMDFSQNLHGEIAIRHLKPEEVLLSPDDSEYDPKHWREVFTACWQSLDEIEAHYSKEAARKVRDIAQNGTYFTEDSLLYEEHKSTFAQEAKSYDQDGLDPREHKDIKAVRVIDRQWKKVKLCRQFIDPVTGDKRPVPANWSQKRVDFVQEAYQLKTMVEPMMGIRWTVSADRVLLKDTWSPYRTFTVIPYFCYWIPGRPFGVVENLLSPQDQLNKVSSQELHIVNSTANGGWMYQDGAIANHSDDEMAAQGSKTGLVVTYRKGYEKPEKIQPNQIPTGIDRLAMNTANNIKEISGVGDSLLGQDKAEVSGVAIEHKKSQGQVQIQLPLDHLRRTRKLVGHKVLELIQDFYTDERVLFITNDGDIGAPREPLRINTVTPEAAVVNDLTLGVYDIVVTSQPARDAFRDSQFGELLEMRNAGVAVPGYRVVENSHLAQKDEIAREVQQLEGLSQQTPEEQQLANMQMQMSLQQMQLSLEKLGAEIAKLSSEAQLNQVKAQDLAQSDQIELTQMQMEMEKEREGNQLRRDLATMSAVSGLDKQLLSTRGRIAEEKVRASLADRMTSNQNPQKKDDE